jgi:chorismate synthase
MGGSIFGQLFRITTYGESHGHSIGVVIDGCPAGIHIDQDFINKECARRRPGQSRITTQRDEADMPFITSGIFEGRSTGTPIHIQILNKDQRSKDYNHIKDAYRPSHADNTYDIKYGHRDYRGGGRSSARETAARVAAGAIAKLVLKEIGVSVTAYVSQVGSIKMTDQMPIDMSVIEDNVVRAANLDLAVKMQDHIESIKNEGDTIGGVVSCVINGCPAGIGEPVFDKLHADLGKAMLSINAVKGFEYGSGFRAVTMKGSEHNDEYYKEGGDLLTKTNNNGGIQGGISNGMDINFNVAFKPVATIIQDQNSIDQNGNPVIVKGKGRHDPCVVPRAVPIVEAMAALIIVDHYLRQKVVQL